MLVAGHDEMEEDLANPDNWCDSVDDKWFGIINGSITNWLLPLHYNKSLHIYTYVLYFAVSSLFQLFVKKVHWTAVLDVSKTVTKK